MTGQRMAFAVRILQPFLSPSSGHERRPCLRRRPVSPVGRRAGTAPHAVSGSPGRSLQRTRAPPSAHSWPDASWTQQRRKKIVEGAAGLRRRTTRKLHSELEIRADQPLCSRGTRLVSRPDSRNIRPRLRSVKRWADPWSAPNSSLDDQTDADTGGRTGYYRPRIAMCCAITRV